MRILITEDEPNDAELLTLIVGHAGHEAIIARNGLEALERAKEGVDLVLMDLVMPEMDGLTAARRLKEDPKTAGLPVIAVTALVLPPEELLAAGMKGVILKPFTLQHFLREFARLNKA